MKEIIPYKKEILFNTKLSEISSISLEYEANVLEEEIAGDFVVSGDYKVHEVSVNKEPFKYRLPFSIELSDSIIRDSLKYDIYDFTYEIKNDDTLVVNISFLVEGDEVEEVLEAEEVSEEDKIDDSVKEDRNMLDEEESVPHNNEVKDVVKDDNDTNNIVMNNIKNQENTYVVYHVYVYHDNDTIDDVINKFNTSKDVIMEYNNTLDFKSGDKVLIPELVDE